MKKLFICLFAVSMVLVLVGFAVAADWSFYGSARTGTWWYSRDSKTGKIAGAEAFSSVTGSPETSGLPLASGGGGNSDFDLSHSLQSNARIGATVTSGDVSGRFEYGASDGKANIRILRGTWNLGPGELTVGQDYTPISWTWYSNQVVNNDEGLLGLGLMYAGRKPMLQYKSGGFKIALVEPNVVSAQDVGYVGSLDKSWHPDSESVIDAQEQRRVETRDTDVVLPKIEIAYQYTGDNFFVDMGAGFQTYDFTNANDEHDASLTSWVVGIGGAYNFGRGYAQATAKLRRKWQGLWPCKVRRLQRRRSGKSDPSR